MQARLVAGSLAVLLVVGPISLRAGQADDPIADALEDQLQRRRTPLRIAGQAIAGPALGLAAGYGAFWCAIAAGYGEDRSLSNLCFRGLPVAFALGEAYAVHRVGRVVDRDRQGSLVGTLAGAVVGTTAGAGVYAFSDPHRSYDHLDRRDRGRLAASVAIATAATITGYELTRPRRARRTGAPTVAIAPTLPMGRAPADGAWGFQVGVAF